MKTTLATAIATALVLTVLGQMEAYAAETPATAPVLAQSQAQDDVNSNDMRKNGMSLELLGRGLLYSFNYDRMVTDNIAVGMGVSHYSISSGDSNASAWILPVYANYYVTGGHNRWFLTGGADLAFASGNMGSDSKVSGSGVAGVLGAGFEHRGDNGFLFRVAPYALVGKMSGGWIGVSFGYAI